MTTWGSYSSHYRIGLAVSQSPSTVTKDTSSVTLTWHGYAQNATNWDINDDTTVTRSNAMSGSETFGWYTGYDNASEVQTINTWNQVVSTSYSSSVSKTLELDMSGVYNGATPHVQLSHTIARRPPQPPDAPTSASVSRTSDTHLVVSWTAPSSWDGSSAYWDTIRTQRSKNGGAWYTVSVMTNQGNRSFDDTSTTSNYSYRYRVRAENESGSSSWEYTDYIQTTPDAPTDVTATKVGSDITVTWTDENYFLTTWDIDDSTDGGSMWTNVATGLSDSPASWTDVAPASGDSHTYRVRAITTYYNPSAVTGPWSTQSNTVTILAAPDAPTDLSPDAVAVDSSGTALLTWQHNATDTTAQTAYDVGYSINGGTWTYTGQTTSTTSEFDITSLLSEGDSVDWKVRTWGDYSSPGSYSAVASFDWVAAPTATVDAPTDASTLTTSGTTVSWSYYQAESHTQAGWQTRVTDTSDSTIVATSSGSTATSWDTPDVLEDGATYTVEARVRSSDGLWSAWDLVTVDVSYLPPVAPNLALTFDPEYGRVLLEVSANSDGSSPETVDIYVERQESNGDWTLVADSLGVDANVYDYECPIAESALTYRATAVSATPSEATTSDTVDTTPTTSTGRNVGVYLSGGADFATVCSFAYKVKTEFSGGRRRVLRDYDGRESPVETSGVPIDKIVSVTAVVLRDALEDWEATRESLEALAEEPGPHLYRDCTGRLMFCSLSDIKATYDREGEVSFTVTRASNGTPDQLDAIAASAVE